MPKSNPVEPVFSCKYDRGHFEPCLHEHQDGWAHRLSHWRDAQLACYALKVAILSLWVDGNYQAWKRRQLELRRVAEGRAEPNRNRFVVTQAVIKAEFEQAGFQILGYKDFVPGYAMGRTYVLRKKHGARAR